MILCDTHAHLDSSQFSADRLGVLDRAQLAGVAAIVTVGTDLASSKQAVALAAEQDMLYPAVGIHPHKARKADGASLAELRELAHNSKVVAVGEIGLDFFRDLSPRDLQRRAFQAQLALAAELGKPVIVHDRDAHAEVLKILQDWTKDLGGTALAGRAGVLHTFSGDLPMAQRALELGFYLSVSGSVTREDAYQLCEILKEVPVDRLLVETDCPYLTPLPNRGRNEPAYVRLVAERVADVLGLAADDLAAATTANARRLFGW